VTPDPRPSPTPGQPDEQIEKLRQLATRVANIAGEHRTAEEMHDVADFFKAALASPLPAGGLWEFVAAYDAWQVGKAEADVDGDWLRIAPLYDAMVDARARLAPAPNREAAE
jgi:hypothetical protein